MLRLARRIYFNYLETCSAPAEPIGVVMVGESVQGRVVFDPPVLLPEEQYVPMELLRVRSQTRSRTGRSAAARPPADPRS